MSDHQSVRVTCPACNKRLRVKAAGTARKLRCPACGSAIVLPSTPNESTRPGPAAASSGLPSVPKSAEDLARLLNEMTPSAGEGLSQALQPERPEQATERVPIGTLGCLLPLACMCIMGVLAAAVASDLNYPAAVFLLGCGGYCAYRTFRNMKRKWTPARIVWSVVVLLFLAAAYGGAARDKIRERRMTPHLQPLLAEFPTFPADSHQQDVKPIQGKLFPIAFRKRGETEKNRPLPPQPDFETFWMLPASLRAHCPDDEVGAVALVDWWYAYQGEYRGAGGTKAGRAYEGRCSIRVVDRRTRALLAEVTLVSSKRAPKHRILFNDWYGPQPTVEEVAEYLGRLPHQ